MRRRQDFEVSQIFSKILLLIKMPRPKYTACDDTYSLSQPCLTITPEKLCQMPYLSNYKESCAGDPWASAGCENFTLDQMQEYNCMTPGFNGRPVHFEYSVESGADWKNARCVGDACGECKQPKVL